MDRLLVLHAFIQVIECGSFSAAAACAGTTQPVISKRIAQLERSTGARLLQRGARRVVPTDDGQRLYERARRLLADAAELFDGIGARHAARLAGSVSIGASAAFARRVLLPRLPPLMALYPGLQVTLTHEDVLPAGDGTSPDISLRCHSPRLEQRTRLDSVRVGNLYHVLVATPGYLQRRGRPHTAADLALHDCILDASSGQPEQWLLQTPAHEPLVQGVAGRLRVANAELLRGAVLQGLGVALVPAWLLADELRSGQVLPVLAQHTPAPWPLHAWTATSRRASERVHRVLQFFIGEFAIDPFLAGYAC